MGSDFQSEAFGKYIIRSGFNAGVWQARALRGHQVVGDTQSGDTRQAAIEAVKANLSARDAAIRAERGRDGSPSALEYAEAFDRIGRLPKGHEAMLDAHLKAPDHLITATQLADAAGYANWSAANLQYGKLARRLAEELDYNPPLRDDGTPIWTYALATSPDEGDLSPDRFLAALARGLEEPHFEWHLRPQVAEVLAGRR